MVDSSNIYREQQKAVALEFMEKALAILVEVDDSAADCYLQRLCCKHGARPRGVTQLGD
ncbi:hypothetical protein [Sphingobium fuliginis]|uniref:hypothetical protein n=1 Tax=Sphingobium fuliginis (strain ATCC 27551) TaxID=336203 RepID=UPI001430E2F1|nr:hypothetical protein [Sphingobium fuliginis]